MNRVWIWSGLALAAVVAGAGLSVGPTAAGCALLGAAVSAINLYGLHRVTVWIGAMMGERKQTIPEFILTAGFALLKLPVLAFGFLLVRDQGQAASAAFLAGFGVVYFALLGWAQATTSAHS